MIIGNFEGIHPYTNGYIEIQRLGVRGTVEFLVDTGADVTCIHPKDGSSLFIPYDDLRNGKEVGGIGGTSLRYPEPAILSFRESTGAPVHRYRIEVRIGKPEDVDEWMPSVLGQDILKHWRTIHEPDLKRVEFHVRSSSYSGL